MSSPSIDDYDWLIGDQAAQLLNVTTDLDPLAVIERLRRQLPQPRAQLVAQQLELRRRAAGKFSQAAIMFFTARGMEQSSGEVVARYKAHRFTPHRAVADLCCGIGGDLIGLAARRSTAPADREAAPADKEIVGVDSDRVLAKFAAANAQACGATATTRCGDACSLDVQQFDAWHMDPDRRAGGTRTTDVSYYAPDLAALNRLLSENADAAIKLAPGVDVPGEWVEMAEVEWISHDRECRQAVAWFGTLLAGQPNSQAGRRRATRLDRDGKASSYVGRAGQSPERASRIRRFVFEPDTAVLAADLGGDFARHHDLAAFASSQAYLTADHPVDDALLACFEVSDVLPFDVRKVKRLMQSRGIGRLEVKKRGVEIDPNKIARQMKTDGSGQATLLLARVQGAVTAILATRVSPRSAAASKDSGGR